VVLAEAVELGGDGFDVAGDPDDGLEGSEEAMGALLAGFEEAAEGSEEAALDEVEEAAVPPAVAGAGAVEVLAEGVVGDPGLDDRVLGPGRRHRHRQQLHQLGEDVARRGAHRRAPPAPGGVRLRRGLDRRAAPRAPPFDPLDPVAEPGALPALRRRRRGDLRPARRLGRAARVEAWGQGEARSVATRASWSRARAPSWIGARLGRRSRLPARPG